MAGICCVGHNNEGCLFPCDVCIMSWYCKSIRCDGNHYHVPDYPLSNRRFQKHYLRPVWFEISQAQIYAAPALFAPYAVSFAR